MASSSERFQRRIMEEMAKKRANDVSEGVLQEVTLEMCRESEEEGLGMVLGVEEAPHLPSGRRVVVKSVTPHGPAARAATDDVTDEGFRVRDRVLRIDDDVLDDMSDEDCLTVLQEFPQNCVVVVERLVSPSSSLSSSSSSSSSSAKRPRHSVDTSPNPSDLSSTSLTSARTAEQLSRNSEQSLSAKDEASSYRDSAKLPSRILPSSGSASSAGDDIGKSLTFPRPSSRKVRRQKSTAAHLAEKGLPGFQVRRVMVRRPEGSSLGLSIVPSCGATKFYYQVKRLLPGGVCAQTPGLHIGDRLLECNGHSLQNLTQAQCLDVLKNAGPRVTLTLLHEEEGGSDDDGGGGGGDVTAQSKEGRLQEYSREPRIPEEPNRDHQADRDIVEVEDRGTGEPATVSRTVVRLESEADGSHAPAARTRSRAGNVKDTSGDAVDPETSPDDMSNPFLDPDYSAENGVVPDQPQNHQDNSNIRKSNPFYQDLVHDGDNSSQPGLTSLDSQTPVDAGSGMDDARDDGVVTEDILLDVSDDVMLQQQPPGGEVNVSGDSQDGGPFVGNIPPPMEFSDFGDASFVKQEPSDPQPGPGNGDLLTMDFPSDVNPALSPASVGATSAPTDGAGTNGSEDGFDFLLDVEEARNQPAPYLLTDIAEEEPPQLPSSPPPPVPTGPPPPVPVGEFVDEDALGEVVEDSQEEYTTGSDVNGDAGVSITDDVVNNVSHVTVATRNEVTELPAHGQSSTADAETLQREEVMDEISTPSQQTQFSASRKNTEDTSRLPSDTFTLTSMGITRTVRSGSSPGTTDPEEEQIAAMEVTRGPGGVKLGKPSSPEMLGRQSVNGPRKLDEAAKNDLQVILTQMTQSTRGLPVVQKSEEGPAVSEDEIVPVKLTRREAEMAQDVLSKWMSQDSQTPSSSPASPFKKSGFQRVVGNVMDVQSGRVPLPANSVPLTTMGVTGTPKARGETQQVEEEITPMSHHKDESGRSYYAPSPKEALGRQTDRRQLDSAAKQDIAALMSVMPAKSKRKEKPAEDQGDDVAEDEIVATVLSKKESVMAMEAVNRWLNNEAERQPKASPFQRLVDTVIETSTKTEEAIPNKEQLPEVETKSEIVQEQVEETPVASSQISTTSSAPALSPKSPPPEVALEESPAPTSPKTPDLKTKPIITQRTSVSQRDPTPSSNTDLTASSGQRADSAADARPAPVDVKPVPTQRHLRAPAKITPLAKIGTLSVSGRGTTPAMLAPKQAAKAEYGKTRSTDTPFLVEVLKGIVGLGLKVKVNAQGQVEVTEVQRNSPVDKNGNIRVGDYLLSINTTELRGLSEGRVQQVLRLLPRGLIKLVVTAQPPPPSEALAGDATSPDSPRSAGAYTQYGVRLSPQPFSPTSSDGQPSSFSNPSSPRSEDTLSADAAHPTLSEVTEEDDMSVRKLSKALSPRSAAQETFTAEPPSPPKPAPRPRSSVVTPVQSPRNDSSVDEASDSGSPRKTERKLTASEIVAAASRRPSGRDDDLPQPPPVSPKGEAFAQEEVETSPRQSSTADPVLAASRSPSGVESPREDVPVFDAVSKKTDGAGSKAEIVDEVFSAQSMNESQAAPPPAVTKKAKIPPPVAPKPKRPISVSSDKSYSSVHSENSPKDLPSPTTKQRDFPDGGPPSGDDQTQSRKFVSSAARMFERKATESKPVSPLTQPTKSSVPVSSVVKSFSRDAEADLSPRWTVGPKRSVGGPGWDSGKPINSALLPPGDRRKSTGVSSLQLTKPSSLSQLKAPLTARGRLEETDTEKSSSRFNSALRPRQGSSSTTSSLRSVIASKEHKEEKEEAKDKDEVTPRPRPSPRGSSDVTSRSKHTSWSPQSNDPHSPKMIFTSSSLHHTSRYGSSSSPSWHSEQDDNLESTMKKFDDLLSDKHTLDSDEELPKVSNSVSLDFSKARSAGRTSAKSSEKPSSQTPAQDSPVPREDNNKVDSSVTESKDKAAVLMDKLVEDVQSPKVDSARIALAETSKTDLTEITSEKPQVVEVSHTEGTEVAKSSSDVETPAEESVEKVEKEQVEETVIVQKDVDSLQNQQAPEPVLPKSTQEPVLDTANTQQTDVEKADTVSTTSAALDTSMTEDAYPDEDQPAPMDMSVGEDTYPQEDTTVSEDMAQEVMYQQQASTIVQTVLSRALQDVNSAPKPAEEDEEDDGPPPLPGAPPPPLILRSNAERLVEAEDLEELPTQETASSLKSSPRSDVDPPVSSEVSPRLAEDVQVETQQEQDIDVPSISPERETVSQSRENQEPVPVTDSDVMISFHSTPSESVPLSVNTSLLKEVERDTTHGEHPPVSDTLSQDSGVQDGDMSEDGLRSSQDDSPTSQVDSSVFDSAMTPDELPASVMSMADDTTVCEEKGGQSPTSTKSPVPSPRPRASQASPRLPSSPPPSAKDSVVVSSSNDTCLVEDISVPQRSLSAEPNEVQSQKDESVESKIHISQDIDAVTQDSLPNANNIESPPDTPQSPKTAPPSTDHNDLSSPNEETPADSAVVKSSRKWSILDQSGSLFLQGAGNSTVTVAREVIRQVSSMLPGELADMLAEGNKDLDSAKLPKTVELRVVSARGLNGRPLSVDVTQREDYFVQVTRVHTKDSTLEEADLLLSVDGRTLKHRRPAQVHSQLESTGPKGVLLTARGVRLPSSLVGLQDGSAQQTANARPTADSAHPASPASPTSPSPAAVEVSPGVYDVIMKKGATGVGFCLEGGKASPKGDLPILIKRIFKGGPAEKCGHLKVRDEILAVNGVDFTTMRHYEAWNHLKFLDDGEIKLRIRRQQD